MGEVTSSGTDPLVIVVVGPTAAGKTTLAIRLAERSRGEIVSADARQVYRRLDIGTAKPSRIERERAPHHFIDILDPRESYTSGRFGLEAIPVIQGILSRGRTPIVVGGSGLYVKSVVDGIFEGPEESPALRKKWEAEWRQSGEEGLRRALREVDPESERSIERGKPRRLVRALEVRELTGIALSEHHIRQRRDRPFRFLQFGITPGREALYRSIDRRVVYMIDAGLVEEVRGLVRDGYEKSLNSLNTVGYKEVFEFLDGGSVIETMVARIQMNTRRYAKRQLTWFRADRRVHWLQDVGTESEDALVEQILQVLRVKASL